jgi:hypothetical protein
MVATLSSSFAHAAAMLMADIFYMPLRGGGKWKARTRTTYLLGLKLSLCGPRKKGKADCQVWPISNREREKGAKSSGGKKFSILSARGILISDPPPLF